MPEIQVPWKALLKAGLQEDHFRLDMTTLGVLESGDRKITAKLIAKSKGIWVGNGALQAAIAVAREEGFQLQIKTFFKDGDAVQPKDLVAELKGSAQWILPLERTLLNLVSFSSGIATETREVVSTLQKIWKKKKHPGNPPRITATRKILPYYRELAWHAVIAGGGDLHRLNLSSGVLIKENHLTISHSISKAITQTRRHAPHLSKVEIEVKSLDELKEAVESGAEIVMLDNFSSAQTKQALKFLKENSPKTHVEISGGVRIETLDKVALPGVHTLSLGKLTHSVEALDLSLLVDE